VLFFSLIDYLFQITDHLYLSTLFLPLAKFCHSDKSARKSNKKGFLKFIGGGAVIENTNDNVIGDLSQVKLQELLIFNFDKLVTATNNFHPSNRLGQGGFGPVYKVHYIELSYSYLKPLSIVSFSAYYITGAATRWSGSSS